MTKSEFEEMIGGSVMDEEYQLIEEVYMWHPAIRNTSGKEEVAELYKSFGIVIFYDMYPRAKKAKDIEDNIRELKLFLTLFCLPCGHKLIFGAEKNFISEI